jgi:hypothetical protein
MIPSAQKSTGRHHLVCAQVASITTTSIWAEYLPLRPDASLNSGKTGGEGGYKPTLFAANRGGRNEPDDQYHYPVATRAGVELGRNLRKIVGGIGKSIFSHLLWQDFSLSAGTSMRKTSIRLA